MKGRFLTAPIFLMVSCVAFASEVASQSISGSISGIVRDEQQAVLTGATITIRSTETNSTRITQTDARGEYRLLALQPGTYTVTVDMPGFVAETLNDIIVAINAELRLTSVLRVAGVNEQLVVTETMRSMRRLGVRNWQVRKRRASRSACRAASSADRSGATVHSSLCPPNTPRPTTTGSLPHRLRTLRPGEPGVFPNPRRTTDLFGRADVDMDRIGRTTLRTHMASGNQKHFTTEVPRTSVARERTQSTAVDAVEVGIAHAVTFGARAVNELRTQFAVLENGLTERYCVGCPTENRDGLLIGTSPNPQNIAFLPQDHRNPGAERGPSLSDVRHRFAGTFTAELPWSFQLASVVIAESAPPYSVTMGRGVDLNFDIFDNDRPPGVARNTERGDDFWQIDVRVSKWFGSGSRRVELLAEVFNLANHRNWASFNGVLTSKTFRQPGNAEPPRQVQLGIRVDF